MLETIEIDSFLTRRDELPVIDVRSPVEYARGHIPGSINIPLFSDEERAAIGTLYKNQGQEEAVKLGESYAVPRIEDYVRSAGEAAKDGRLMVYCFRGGLRSRRFSELLSEKGFHVWRLDKGYKSYRRAAGRLFDRDYPYIVLGGRTGSGKTEILQEMSRAGRDVVDLEGLSNHRGSAFGSIGMGNQPTTEMFENRLFDRLYAMIDARQIWVEDESINIGRVFLPEKFYRRLREAPVVLLRVPRELRLDRLCRDYTACGTEPLKDSVGKIRKRLGGERAAKALDAIDRGDLRSAASIVLEYYDKCYDYGISEKESRISERIDIPFDDPGKAAELLILKAVDRRGDSSPPIDKSR